MERDDFLKAIDEMLELAPGTVSGPETLDDFPLWDSSAIISFMALADSHNGTRLTAKQIGACQTVSELLALCKVE
jgi:acyl carrier protein